MYSWAPTLHINWGIKVALSAHRYFLFWIRTTGFQPRCYVRGPNIFDRFGNALWQKRFWKPSNLTQNMSTAERFETFRRKFSEHGSHCIMRDKKKTCTGFNGSSEATCQPTKWRGLCWVPQPRWRGLHPSARGLLLDWPSTPWHRAPWIQEIVVKKWVGFGVQILLFRV